MVKRKNHFIKYYNPAEDLQQSWPRENKILLELRKQKLSGMLCDVVFVYENFELYSHACVLASFSPFLVKLLLLDHASKFPNDNWCFKPPLKINLTDILYQRSHVCWKCFNNIIEFMYTSKIYMYDCHLSHVEYAATVFQISELISVCTKFKQSEYKKPKFDIDKCYQICVENDISNTIKNKTHHELKLFHTELNQVKATDPENINNPALYKNNINECLETSGIISNTKCQNSEKSETATFKAVQNSNKKKTYEVEAKEQHQKVSKSVFKTTLPGNFSALSSVIIKEKVKEPLRKNFVLPNQTNSIKLNGNMSAEQSRFKIHSENIKNIIAKQKFSVSKTLTENESPTQIVNYTANKNQEPSLTCCENKEDKGRIDAERKKDSTSASPTENQFHSLKLQQENDIVLEKTARLCDSNYVEEENNVVPAKCTIEIKETVESKQTEDNNTSKNKKLALINIPFSTNRRKQSCNEEEMHNNCDNTEKEDITVCESILNDEDFNRNQLINLTVNELHTSLVKNKGEKNKRINKQVLDSNKNAFETDVTESSESSMHQIVVNNSKNNHNVASESHNTFRKDNHESRLNVFESKKENKMNIQENGSMKTKEKTKFCCEVCQYKTLRLSKIVEHLETVNHSQTSCSICKYTFNDNIELKQHLKLHKGDLPFQCLTCNRKFKSVTKFQDHVPIHSTKKTFVCSICNASFKHSCNLSKHTVKMHSQTLDKKYTCEHCEFTTSVKYNLVLHLQEHGFTVPVFTCSVSDCKFQTFREISLTGHTKTHFKTETFVCETCGTNFFHLRNLKRHTLEKHNPESLRSYNCSKCNYVTRRQHSLNIHLTSHTKNEVKCKTKKKKKHIDRKPVDKGTKPYKCEICEEQFVNRGNVQRHKKEKHNLGIKMICSTCSYRTTREDLYKKHIMKHTQTTNHLHKYRKHACKTNNQTANLIKTISNNKNALCQPSENRTEIPKCSSDKLLISDNKTRLNKRENNEAVKNHNNVVSNEINSTEETGLHPDRTQIITNITDGYNKVYICEICGETVVSEENFQTHKSEKHSVQHASVSQVVREDCYVQNKITPDAKTLDKNTQTSNFISVLIPINKSVVTDLTSNVPTAIENKNCVVLTHYNSDKQNILSINQHRNENLVDSNFSLPLTGSVTKAVNDNKEINQDCTHKEQFKRTNEKRICCNVQPSEKQNENSSLSNSRTLVLNKGEGKLDVTDSSGIIEHTKQNDSDNAIVHYSVTSNCNTTQTSVNNFCETLNSGNCNMTTTCSNNIECANIENTQTSIQSGSSDIFSLHNVTELNRTVILNDTPKEIHMIMDNNTDRTNDSENGNMCQNGNSGILILDESTGTLINISVCNKQADESLALNDQREVISFPNSNTSLILNEGTGELTFTSLNSDVLEKNENSDILGSSQCFDDDTISNFSVDSQDDMSFDNIPLPSPVSGNERNSGAEFLNELTGEINFCNFTSDNNSNIVNNTNYINSNCNEKNNDGMTWNTTNDEDEDLTFLNELTGEILQSTSKLNNKSNILSDSVRMEDNSLPVCEARNNTNVGSEILNETTGEFSAHLDELTKESADSMYLNEETGIISWNTLNQETSGSNILNNWFFENLQNDSLDSFTADDDNFSKQFQYNLFLNSPCEDLTLNVGSNDTLLNESTGELVSKTDSESQQ